MVWKNWLYIKYFLLKRGILPGNGSETPRKFDFFLRWPSLQNKRENGASQETVNELRQDHTAVLVSQLILAARYI